MAGELSADGAPQAGENDAVRRALIALAITLGGGSLVFFVVEPIAATLGIRSDLGINSIGNLLWLGIAIAGALLLGHRLVFGIAPPWLAALPLGMVGYAAALALVALSGHAQMVAAAPIVPSAFLVGTLGLALGALAEETLFRGFLQPLLCRAWGTTAGVVIAAMAFIVEHFIGGWRDPITLANIGLAGAWFGLLAVRSRGLGVPFLAHAGWNWTEALLFGAAPNPGHDPAGSIFDVDLVGPSWLGGSVDGMNSALPATLVLALLIAPLLIWHPRIEDEEAKPVLPRRPLPELRP